MKLKYIFTSLVAVCALAIGCTKSYPTDLDNIKLSQSTVGLPSEKVASVTVTVNATEDWAFDESNLTSTSSWLTVAPTSGKAGETKVVFTTKAASAACNKATLTIKCGSNTQYVIVQQGKGAAINTAETAFTADEAIEFYADGKNKGAEVYVKGVVTSAKIDVSYGNAEFYLANSKGISFEFYRCLDFEGEKFTDKEKVQVGDIIVGVGSLTNYNTTVELDQGCKLVSITKSLVKVCDETVLTDIDSEGADVDVKVIAKGGDFRVKTFTDDSLKLELDWVSVKSIDIKEAVKDSDPDTTVVKVHVAANENDTRSGLISFSSGTSTVDVAISQKSGLNAYTLPYSETFAKGIGAWEIVNSELPEGLSCVWSWDEYGYMKATGYVSSEKKTYDANSSLQSPLIDLTKATTATLTFEQAQRFGPNNDVDLTLWVSKDNGEIWQQVLIPEYSDGKSWNCITSTVSLTAFVGNQIKIMFEYNSVSTGCATWEIKNIQVKEGEADITSIAQLAGQTPAANKAETTFKGTLTDATVTYINGNYVYLQDATGAILLYQSGHGLAVGDSFTGEVSGTISNYNALPELKAIDFTKAVKTTGKSVTPMEITIDKLNSAFLRYMSYYIKINDVEFKTAITKSNRNGLITDGTNEIIAYASVNKTLEMSGKGSLVCFPTVYGSTGSLMGATPELSVWSNDHWTTTK